MNDDFASCWRNWCLDEIKDAMQLHIGLGLGVEPGWTQHVECDENMLKDMFPCSCWERWVYSTAICNEMIL